MDPSERSHRLLDQQDWKVDLADFSQLSEIMNGTIRLLQVEDSARDAELIVEVLERSGYKVCSTRVETEEQMRAVLSEQQLDLVIADYRLPRFSAPAALQVFQESQLDVPFIVLSGAIGEDTAISMMKMGAHNYLLKGALERLPHIVEKELQDATLRLEKREAGRRLRAAYTELETIYANTPILMFAVGTDVRVQKINELAACFCGRSIAECVGKPLYELLKCALPPGKPIGQNCSGSALFEVVSDAFQSGMRHDPIEVWMSASSAQGELRCLLVSVAPVATDCIRSVLICAQDVTRRKEIEHSLEESVRSLEASLAQNTVLFQEVHHRVKNNLQIVASLLSMKARKGSEDIGVDDLKSCERRIRSMAMIHELLYRQRDLTHVDFAHYVRMIVPELIASYEREFGIDLRFEVGPAMLSMDQAIPSGLILNELVTNAVKYAYPKGRGEILVRLATANGMVRLTVADHGVGMPALPNTAGTSLGLELVRMLAKQLRGTLEFSSGPGTTICLTFTSGLYSAPNTRHGSPCRLKPSLSTRHDGSDAGL